MVIASPASDSATSDPLRTKRKSRIAITKSAPNIRAPIDGEVSAEFGLSFLRSGGADTPRSHRDRASSRRARSDRGRTRPGARWESSRDLLRYTFVVRCRVWLYRILPRVKLARELWPGARPGLRLRLSGSTPMRLNNLTASPSNLPAVIGRRRSGLRFEGLRPKETGPKRLMSISPRRGVTMAASTKKLLPKRGVGTSRDARCECARVSRPKRQGGHQLRRIRQAFRCSAAHDRTRGVSGLAEPSPSVAGSVSQRSQRA